MAIWVGPGGRLSLGDRVGLSNSTIVCQQSVSIEDDVFVGGGSRSTTRTSTRCARRTGAVPGNPGARTRSVTIRRRAFVGGHSTVLKGVTVGEEAVVGAGSVVRSDVPDVRDLGRQPRRLRPKPQATTRTRPELVPAAQGGRVTIERPAVEGGPRRSRPTGWTEPLVVPRASEHAIAALGRLSLKLFLVAQFLSLTRLFFITRSARDGPSWRRRPGPCPWPSCCPRSSPTGSSRAACSGPSSPRPSTGRSWSPGWRSSCSRTAAGQGLRRDPGRPRPGALPGHRLGDPARLPARGLEGHRTGSSSASSWWGWW